MELLNRELTRSQRESGCTAVLLCDIDHFKSVNDTHGHPVGDEALREVARRLLASVRSYDFVGRYGGEEFLVVLNNCDPAFVLSRAEQMRQAIAGREVITDGGPLALTISIGVLRSVDWLNLPAAACLAEVDVALYAAKAAGRNCVRLGVPSEKVVVASLQSQDSMSKIG